MTAISTIQRSKSGGWDRLSVEVNSKEIFQGNQNLWIEVPENCGEFLNTTTHAFLVAMLLPAMRFSASLRMGNAVTGKTLRKLAEVQRAFSCISRELHQIEITCASEFENGAVETGEAHAVFFSGGVDSLHAMHRVASDASLDTTRKPKYLIPVHGMDIPLDRKDQFSDLVATASSLAEFAGWNVLPVRTNIAEVLFPWPIRFGYTEFGFAPTLFAVAHALSVKLATVYIASGVLYSEAPVNCSSPGTDHLWSSERLEVINVGAELSRIGKIKEMSDWKHHFGALKVCHKLDCDGVLNCGNCEKCSRTILSLHACELLDAALPAFPAGIENNLERIALSLLSKTPYVNDLYREMQNCFSKRGDITLVNAIERAIAYSHPSPLRKSLRDLDRRYLKSGLDRLHSRVRDLIVNGKR
jgi:hypothetical protein